MFSPQKHLFTNIYIFIFFFAGVYFSARVEHIKFVDFCGKYRLPLLAYLCSPECTTTTPSVLYSSASDSDTDMSGDEVVSAMRKMKKVLLPPSL